jgi:hypothetical protein
MKKSILEKLTSRKFIVTVITAITGVITMIIGENEVVQVISGAAMTIIPTVVYCLMEGFIDAKSVETITRATADAAEKLGADEKVVDIIEQVGEVGEILVESDNPEE